MQTHTHMSLHPAPFTLLAGMINPVQSGKILTLNRKVLLRVCEAVIYFGSAASTLIISMQVQAQIPLSPAVARCTHK